MAASGPIAIFLTSLLAFPMMYATDRAQAVHGELGLFVVGTVCLVVVCLLAYWAIGLSSDGGKPDWLLYVFALGTFAAAVDVTIGLETDGYVAGFMSAYLRNGEPYLGTPYGALISYWDGTAHYALYAYMLTAMALKRNFREVGLYWAGSIGHSMLILIPGAVVGKFGVRWSFLLNVPYIFIPFLSAARFLNERPAPPSPPDHAHKTEEGKRASVWRRPLDLLLILSLVTSMAVAVLRGFAVLGCQHGVAVDYIKYYEPYLNDPVAFPKIQMLVYLFYFVPFYVLAIHGLVEDNTTWLSDWTILFAGAAAQAQVPHILSSFHARTLPQFRVPLDSVPAMQLFWLVNALLLLAAPHILAARCLARTQSDKTRTGAAALQPIRSKQKQK